MSASGSNNNEMEILNEINQNVAVLISQFKDIQTKVNKHDEALYGNGKPGLVTDIAMIKKWIDEKDWVNKLVMAIAISEFAAIVIAMVVYFIRIKP